MPAIKISLIQKLQAFIKRKTSQKYRFNQQYEKSNWEGLKGLGELGRYSIIVGYAYYFFKAPSILDLGCGEGILQERLAATNYTSYLGIDFSEVAIANAKKLENSNTFFAVGDLNYYTAEGIYDLIIYNESLYYLSNPAEVVSKLFPHLSKDGLFIFSLVDKHGKEQTGLWETLATILHLLESTKVTNSAGHLWTINVYKVKY